MEYPPTPPDQDLLNDLFPKLYDWEDDLFPTFEESKQHNWERIVESNPPKIVICA
jgi:hypothetical protein